MHCPIYYLNSLFHSQISESVVYAYSFQLTLQPIGMWCHSHLSTEISLVKVSMLLHLRALGTINTSSYYDTKNSTYQPNFSFRVPLPDPELIFNWFVPVWVYRLLKY